MPTAVLVTGDRNWSDQAAVSKALNALQPSILIEGCARGADRCSEVWATPSSPFVEHYHFPAKWDTEGRAAGPKRNERMLAQLLTISKRADHTVVVFAFHDSLVSSKGTKHMVQIARKAGVRVVLHRHVATEPTPDYDPAVRWAQSLKP